MLWSNNSSSQVFPASGSRPVACTGDMKNSSSDLRRGDVCCDNCNDEPAKSIDAVHDLSRTWVGHDLAVKAAAHLSCSFEN